MQRRKMKPGGQAGQGEVEVGNFQLRSHNSRFPLGCQSSVFDPTCLQADLVDLQAAVEAAAQSGDAEHIQRMKQIFSVAERVVEYTPARRSL